MPEVTGFKIPNHDEEYLYADKKVRESGYGEALPVVTGSTDAEFLANIEALCAEKVKYSTFQAIVYPAGSAFDGNSFVAQIFHNTDSSGKKFIKIKAHGVTTTGVFQRVCYQSTWNEPEWEKPPMLLGVEYRTTERWNGSPVYVKLISCGVLPDNSTKNVSIEVDANDVFDIQGYTYSNDGGVATTFNSSGSISVNYNRSTKQLNITTKYTFGSSGGGYYATAFIKYTKG